MSAPVTVTNLRRDRPRSHQVQDAILDALTAAHPAPLTTAELSDRLPPAIVAILLETSSSDDGKDPVKDTISRELFTLRKLKAIWRHTIQTPQQPRHAHRLSVSECMARGLEFVADDAAEAARAALSAPEAVESVPTKTYGPEYIAALAADLADENEPAASVAADDDDALAALADYLAADLAAEAKADPVLDAIADLRPPCPPSGLDPRDLTRLRALSRWIEQSDMYVAHWLSGVCDTLEAMS